MGRRAAPGPPPRPGAPRARGLIAERLDTHRLFGLRPAPAHHEALALVLGDPRVAATLWPGPLGGPRSATQSRARLEEHMAHWERHGFGLWIFFERGTGAPVGYAGPRRTTVQERPEVELAYTVASARWGEGLGTEMAAAAVAAAPRAGLDGLVCFTLDSNLASQRVMEKVGFRYERDFRRAGLPHRLYRLPAAR